MELLVVAGEASGDRHAADVVAALRRKRPSLRFFGMGGPALEAEGVELLYGAHEISVMGIVEVLPRLPRLFGVLAGLVEAAKQRKPAAALLVDVPDFNMRLARRLAPLGVPVVGYVAPTVWAWREGRTRTLAKYYRKLLCILPFEEAFLRERGVDATYVGSPVLDQLPEPTPAATFRRALGIDEVGPVLAVLPGSRRGELSRLLPDLVEACRRIVARRPGTRLLVPVAPGLPRELVAAPFAEAGLSPTLVEGRATEVLGAADVALVASGTATLEAGLMRCPMVVVYRLNALSYVVGRLLVRLRFFSLVNLLADRAVVPELLQGGFTPEAVVEALEPLWEGPAREACLAGLDAVRATLGSTGAAERAADAVLAQLDA